MDASCPDLRKLLILPTALLLTGGLGAQEILPNLLPDVPIIVTADSSKYDDANHMLTFTGLKLEQGDLTIIAEHAETEKLDFNDGMWVFEGNVVFTTSNATINCDWAQLRFKEHLLIQSNMKGEPAHFTQTVEESGAINSGEGKAIVYKFEAGTLELRKEAKFSDGANTISGELITYDMRAQRLRAGSGNSGQVKILIEPPRQEEETESP